MPDSSREDTSQEETTLTREYATSRAFAADLRVLSRLGWEVRTVSRPEEQRPLRLPRCLLRRFMPSQRFRVTYIRPHE